MDIDVAKVRSAHKSGGHSAGQVGQGSVSDDYSPEHCEYLRQCALYRTARGVHFLSLTDCFNVMVLMGYRLPEERPDPAAAAIEEAMKMEG